MGRRLGKTVRVVVRSRDSRSRGGLELELGVDAEHTVRQLKREIAKHWPHAPPMCQRLFTGTWLLTNSTRLAACLPASEEAAPAMPTSASSPAATPAEDVLSLMLVVSLEDARSRMADGKKELRLEALASFARAAPKGSRGALAALTPLLRDEAPDVRVAATLASVATLGDARALEAASAQTKDVHAGVRCAALRALPAMAPVDCATTTALVAGLLADGEKCVQEEAMKSLLLVAPRGGKVAIDSVSLHLRKKRPDVRILALKALVHVARRETGASLDAAIASLGPSLEDSDSNVRLEAAAALGFLVPLGSERAVLVAVARLRHGRMDARVGALKALARDAPHGDRRALEAVSECLLDRTKGLRIEALKVVAQLAPVGDRLCTDAIGECLGDARPEVRLAALRLLPHLAPKDDSRVTAVANALLSDESYAVRRHALEATRLLALNADGQRSLETIGVDEGGPPVGLGGQRRCRSETLLPGLGSKVLASSSSAAALGGGNGGADALVRFPPTKNPLFAAAGMLMLGSSNAAIDSAYAGVSYCRNWA